MRTCGPRAVALLLAVAVPAMLTWGCWRGAKPAVGPPAAAPPEAPSTAGTSPAAAPGLVGEAAPVDAREAGQPPAGTGAGREEPVPAGADAGTAAAAPESEDGGDEAGAGVPAADGGPATAADSAPPPDGNDGDRRGGAPRAAKSPPGQVAVARLPEARAFDQDGPYWARGREELVYRVEFLGITMGYARFTFNGKVLLGGREVYHLSVRAWTSSVLSIIYPINDTIDYYMDTKTLEPLRQEYSSEGRKKDDVATYDQETGRIVYRYKESGEIRKQVEAVPNVYDPVTLAYFFRSREPGEEKGRNVYAGRKVWEISAKPLGVERIATDRGEVETIVIKPVIKRNGKVENKGDLRMWMTRDARKTPVRIYAKFKKIRTWTLVGELMPERKGG